MTTAHASLPEPGQLAIVRQQRFVVTEVAPTKFATTGNSQETAQHLVTLSSIEDDGLGEEIQVIWELEPGASTCDRLELPAPEGFDEPEKLDTFIDAVRWGTASHADVRNVNAPFRSGIDLEDYQLDPVVRAIQMPRANLLIADDVGLGKTIEAGLVAQELILRQRVRRVLIVCPSSLQVQWYEQMRDKFGLDFRIVNSDLMRDLRRKRGLHVNPWTHFPRLITSIDFIKRDRPLRWLREVLPASGEPSYPRKFDLLIVDEAHNIAPAGGGRYAIDSQRTAAIRLLAPHCEHKLFLTATPHNGYPESFTALLELLDNQRFARGVDPDRNQLQTVMVRRLKQELPPKWDGSPRFPERHLEAIRVSYTEAEQNVARALQEYTQSRCQRAKNDATQLYATKFVLKLLKKRLFSSPEAFRTTIEQHWESLQNNQQKSHRRMSKPTVGVLRRQLESVWEEFADDETYEAVTEDAVVSTSQLWQPPSDREWELLQQMLDWAREAVKNPDSKARELLNWLETHIRPQGKWSSSQRAIVFTEYRATQKWLFQQLATAGFTASNRVMTLYGGMSSEDRERIKAAFQASPEVSEVRILLATDAAAEGLDLQNYCSQLIHYEIPWNPNRMEQRNGRIDRHGQKANVVSIYHFVGQQYQQQAKTAKHPGDLQGDLEFLMRAALKVNSIREDLGKVGPVIASQVEEAMLGERPNLDTESAERDAQPVRRLLKFERQVRDRIEKLREQLSETRRQLRLMPENIQSVVEVGLALAEQPSLQPAEREGTYYLPQLQGSWAKCSEGLRHPHTHEMRPIAFDPGLVRGRDDVVLVHLNHQLVQMCLRLLRSEVRSPTGSANKSQKLHRVTARLLPSEYDTPAVVAYGRLVVLGRDGVRLHEEVIVAGGWLQNPNEMRFRRVNVLQLQKLLDAALSEPVPQGVRDNLARHWSKYEVSLRRSLEVRAEERTAQLQKSLQHTCDKEVSDLTAILEDLRARIAKELQNMEAGVQLELFNQNEREQFEKNRQSLRSRWEEIPGEIERETAAIRNRFAEPTPRLFPMAVMYLVPKKLAVS
jgi:SNF2 family DNA or RNA helicase